MGFSFPAQGTPKTRVALRGSFGPGNTWGISHYLREVARRRLGLSGHLMATCQFVWG